MHSYLQMFFEGVEAKVATGVKEEEIGYQLAYSKAELRKVIKEYPGKEVKKNLEHLYKKVEKQMCEEENLLQVKISLIKYFNFRDLARTLVFVLKPSAFKLDFICIPLRQTWPRYTALKSCFERLCSNVSLSQYD